MQGEVRRSHLRKAGRAAGDGEADDGESDEAAIEHELEGVHAGEERPPRDGHRHEGHHGAHHPGAGFQGVRVLHGAATFAGCGRGGKADVAQEGRAAMRTWVALLYSITVGGGSRVVMKDLRDLAESLGFERPQTLLATGNLIFNSEAGDAGAVEARLEPAFAAAFGRAVAIIVRDAAAWPALVRGNPFPEASRAGAGAGRRAGDAHPGRGRGRRTARNLPRRRTSGWRSSVAISGSTCRTASPARGWRERSLRSGREGSAPFATGTPSAGSAPRSRPADRRGGRQGEVRPGRAGPSTPES